MCVLGPVSACISVCEGWWPIEGCMGVVFVRIFYYTLLVQTQINSVIYSLKVADPNQYISNFPKKSIVIIT